MRRLLLSTLLLAATTISASAQYNTRVQLQMGNFGTSQDEDGRFNFSNNIINTVGVSFEHRINKNFGIKLAHTRWEVPARLLNGINVHQYGYSQAGYYNPAGTVLARWNYHMLELSPTYSHSVGRHEVYVAAGVSATWGTDDVLLYDYSSSDEGYWICIPNYEKQERKYIGAIAEAGYNIHFLRFMSAGLSVAGRYYNSQFHNFNLQLNIGYNFNSFK